MLKECFYRHRRFCEITNEECSITMKNSCLLSETITWSRMTSRQHVACSEIVGTTEYYLWISPFDLFTHLQTKLHVVASVPPIPPGEWFCKYLLASTAVAPPSGK